MIKKQNFTAICYCRGSLEKATDKNNRQLNRCKHCILPDSLPSVQIDNHGVCNHCVSYRKKYSNWDSIRIKREKDLETIVKIIKSKSRVYDCLIPSGGGKDSTYALYYFAKILKLKCLCVTFDNSYMSELAKKNIQNALSSTGVDHVQFSVNKDTIRQMMALFIKKCGDPCSVCMRCADIFIRQTQKQFKIPVVVFGCGSMVDYKSNFPELFESGEIDFIKNVLIDSIRLPGKDLMTSNSVYHYYYKIRRELASIINRRNIRVLPVQINLYDYLTPDYNYIFKILNREMGWEREADKLHHFDCKLSEISDHIVKLKFQELGWKTLEHSQLIRMGLMERAGALKMEYENRVDNPEFMDEFLSGIQMSREDFKKYILNAPSLDKFRSKKRNYFKIIREAIMQ